MDMDLPPGGSNSTGHMSTIGYKSGVMHHSTSTPAGVDCAGGQSRTPPTTPKKGGKMLAVRVKMLDDTISMFQLQSKALGKVLFEQVCRQLHLLEADYFGLEYQEQNGTKYWLDLEKPISRQVGLSLLEPLLRFCVKFYTPEPARLEEEFTRYLFCLQVKRDLRYGKVQCNENTAALMASYIVQAECGDFVPEDYPDHTYLSGYKFFPQQDADLEHRIMENHKKHIGQSPAEADMNLLETARRCELYGMKMHPAKDHEGVALNLAVAHLGIVVFQHFTKINTFSWAKVRKISFKRKRFLIKLHPEGYGYYKDTVEFFFETRNECKSFWKKCVENHGFFRCSSVKRVARQRTRVLSRGSSFRYSGKTQKQIVEFVRDNYVKRQNFQRCSSLSVPRSLVASRAALWTSGERTINTSVSAHPLLPLPPGSDAISVEWDKQPHYLEASLMMKGYTEEEAREVALGTRRRSEGQTTRPSGIATTYAAMKDKMSDMVTRAEVNHQPMEDLSPHQTTTPLGSPESMWSQSSFKGSATAAISTADDPRLQAPAPDTTTPDEGSMRTEEDSTCGSITLSATSPTQASDSTLSHIVASTPKQNVAKESSCNGLNKTSQPHQNTEEDYATFTKKHIDGDVVTRGVGDSSHSIDVLSGGESDADTLRKANNNNTLHSRRVSEGDGRSAYFAAKELLMTERTYRKHLELVTMWWCGEVSKRAEMGLLSCEAAGALGRPCLALEDVSLAQAQLLHDVDTALATVDHHTQDMDNTAEQQVGDILAEHLRENCEAYARLVGEAGELAARVEAARRRWRAAAEACASVEAERRAPLPLHVYLLRPLHRLIYYHQTLHRLRQLEAGDGSLVEESEWETLEELVSAAQEQLSHAENHAVLCQLQRDITGHDTLLVAGRQFVRLGCLLKHSAHGTQQRMCFLFSDLLLYGAKGSGAVQFRVSAQFPLHTLRMDMDSQQDTFTLRSEDRSVTFSAPNVSEYSAWCHDLTRTLASAPTQDYGATAATITSTASTEDIHDTTQESAAVAAVHYGNSLLHVCWHRGTTLSRQQLHQAMACQLSGYLLRKFKNSHGWQKLWVELGAFCLYFYKSWTDTEPLASLPLLGYRVCLPSAQDAIHKDFVMKLVFKNHIYFFRAESHYTFQRWMEVISTASAQHEGARSPSACIT